jgi:PAS domain S-box-containing protein
VKLPLSLTNARQFAPTDYRRWALGGIAMTAVGFAVMTALGMIQYGFNRSITPRLVIATVLCIVALWLAARRREIEGVLLALAVTWIELQIGFLYAPAFPGPGLIVMPLLLIGIGLLLGNRVALITSIVTTVTTVVMYRYSPVFRDTGFTAQALYWFVLYLIALGAGWVLLTLSVSGFDRVLQELQTKERDLADTIRFAPDGILVLDGAACVVLANPAAEAVLALPLARIVGRSIGDVIDDAAQGSVVQHMLPRDVQASGESPITLQLGRADGTPVHVEATWRAMAGDRRQLLLRDVSERVQAERARREIETQLAHAQRLEAVGQLAGGLSHDFNNILTAVGGSAELLRADEHSPEHAALIDEILAARDRGAALTHQLLAFARREVVQARVLDLATLVSGLERLLARVAGERLQLELHLARDCRVRADVSQLEQALVNLVSNARDATPVNGRCTITVAPATDARGRAVVQLHVQDSGVGMSDDVIARAFEPFFTTKERGQGTGLGLSSVHGMVTQTGGVVHLASHIGSGTRVTLEFPMVSEPLSPTTKTPVGAGTHVGPYTVLVAEDDDAARTVVARLLRRAGYDVLLARDGLDALQQLEQSARVVDLILTDVMMPRLSGPKLATRVRELYPLMPVMFMTGYTELEIESLGERAADRVLITKPFSTDVLTSRVSELLRVVH